MNENFSNKEKCVNKIKYGNKVDTVMNITLHHNFDFQTPSLFVLNEILRVDLLHSELLEYLTKKPFSHGGLIPLATLVFYAM